MKNNNKDLDKEISAITIKIKKGTWKLFKNIIPREITLNQAVINLINKEISKNLRPSTEKEIKELFNPKKGRPENRFEVKQ